MKEWENYDFFPNPKLFLAFQFITNLQPFSIFFFFFWENIPPFICFAGVLAKRYFSVSHLKRSLQVRNVWGMPLGKSGKMVHRILVIIWLIIILCYHRISGSLRKARCFESQCVCVCVRACLLAHWVCKHESKTARFHVNLSPEITATNYSCNLKTYKV